MRHLKAGRRLSRTTEHRLAMLRNLVTSLLEHERVETTRAKAKEVRQWAEQIITLAKRGDLHARRQSLAVVRSKKVVAKLFGALRERFLERPGGYTRIIPLGLRLGDGAPLAIIELVGRPEKLPKSQKKKAASS
ncbi:MAG: 50S ribosomal protein L17 [Deltaproteobacteria bacterium]|nr:50S ribosomal protein L17 [Deltaproteobacteria bacterium]MBI4796968.1 50S ribosomal protein L17 [Deltaproteobacteria bacterium]